MKEFWFTIILFIIIIGGVIANAVYVSTVSERLEWFAEEVDIGKDSDVLIDQLQNYWDKHKRFIGISVDTPQVDAVEKIILSLRLSYDRGESFEFEKYRLHLSEMSREISHLETLSLQTVF